MSGSLYSKNARNKWNFPDKAVTGRISILYTKTFSIQEKLCLREIGITTNFNKLPVTIIPAFKQRFPLFPPAVSTEGNKMTHRGF